MKIIGELNAEGHARLVAAVERVRAVEVGWAAATPTTCAFGKRFLQMVIAGDDKARIASAMFDFDVPPRQQVAWRDAEIRMMAADVFKALPNATRHAVAIILDRAGHDLQRGRSLTDRAPFGGLQSDERAKLEAAVRYVLKMDVHWPRWRTIEDIL